MGAVHVQMQLQGFGDLLADLHQRIEGVQRVLEDHRHFGSPQMAHSLGWQVEDFRAREPDRATPDRGRW